MIVGELRHGQLTILDRLRETVRLSEGLTSTGSLTAPAKARALETLARFGERLRDMHASRVRTAGTSTLRRASDSAEFRREAEQALGHPIEVISGIEEARLIYNGVTHSMPRNDGLRLVLDIGGGSTELILGQGATPRALESLSMGCVVMTEGCFPEGRITHEGFEEARMAARLRLRPVKAFFRDATGIEAIGTSGTIIASELAARKLGIIESHDLSPAAVEKLIERVLEFDSVSELTLSGVSERRAQVWPGGLAILIELLEVLRIESVKISYGALREGLLYDLLGRLRHEDARARSVEAMMRRYHVDEAQAMRVSETALQLLELCAEDWGLQSDLARNLLRWSAALHEIGLDISHDGFHHHGAYVVENADLPGFPRVEQKILAYLIANQRHRVKLEYGNDLPNNWLQPTLRLSLLLRLAVLLNRSRSLVLPQLRLFTEPHALKLTFPHGWLDDNPLTVADLKREKAYVREVDYQLSFE